MSKVDCKNCQFYHNGRCEELGEYTTPGECECSWFAPKAIKKTCVAEIAKNAKQDGARMSKKCHYCGGNAELIGKNLDNEDVFRCKKCGKQGRDDRFSDRPTLFHRITASPEVLAEKLTYWQYDPDQSRCGWTNSIIAGELYKNYHEAITATAAKLKEVAE